MPLSSEGVAQSAMAALRLASMVDSEQVIQTIVDLANRPS